MSLVFRDAFWQIFGRIISALAGFFVIKLLTPYLGPLRYWDYSTVLKYFAIWSALADFWIYVVALNALWKIKDKTQQAKQYSKFLWFRFFMIFLVYLTALIIAYFIPSYTSNPYIFYGLIIWMLFSATFMAAWIVQIPLQLYWQMKHVSIALILARLVQIILLIVLIFFLFPNVDFQSFSTLWLIAFLLVLWTVLLSWLTQFFYVLFVWNKFLKFKLSFDWKFIKENLKSNWKYWISYFLSSFHTLIVLIFLSFMFPTSLWYNYVWIWAVALALIEILLIVPSAFWNSIIHKISSYKKEEKLKSLGYYLTFIIWFWFAVLLNFILFKTQIIYFIAGEKYLTSAGMIGSDFLLPFLAVVLFLSFIKQVFNYVLVSFDKQNKLLIVNLLWVITWIIAGIILIPKYQLIWGIITQLILEICFVIGVFVIAKNYNIFPKLNFKQMILLFFVNIFLIVSLQVLFAKFGILKNDLSVFVYVFLVNIVYLAFSYNFVKNLVQKV